MSFNQNESAMLDLIDAFTCGKITAPDFEEEYAFAWRTYRDSSALKKADIVTQRFFDSVFSLVDSYCSDPELIDEDDLTEDELLSEIARLKTSWESTILAMTERQVLKVMAEKDIDWTWMILDRTLATRGIPGFGDVANIVTRLVNDGMVDVVCNENSSGPRYRVSEQGHQLLRQSAEPVYRSV